MLAPESDSNTPMHFASQGEWAQWLAQHHDRSACAWVCHAKKGAPATSVTYPEALEVALCFGWIDAIKKSAGDHYWLQRWTPRKPGSIWSKVNRESALRYIAEGKMQAPGLAAIERARADGRWEAAYDPASSSGIPPDLQAAFDVHAGAAEFFATVNAQNRYAVLFRIQTAKKSETRARRIAKFAAMLARGETIYP